MTSLDPLVEIPKLTDKDRIVYRFRDAPESVESGLFLDGVGCLMATTGRMVRWENGDLQSAWLGVNPVLILEAVIQPALVPYRGIQMTDAEGELWTYWPDGDEDYPWVDTFGNRLTEEEFATRSAAGELTIFTPEVPA